MLEQRGKGLFIKKEFALAIVDSRHSRFGSQKSAHSGEPVNEWASQPVQTTLIDVSSSMPVSDHEILKLNIAANVMTGLVSRDTGLIAVIKSLVQY